MLYPKFDIITATANNNVIGKDGKLPWIYPEDLEHFHNETTKCPPGSINMVVMGTTTWKEISSYHPDGLPNRCNVVISTTSCPYIRSKKLIGPDVILPSFEEVLNYTLLPIHKCYVIGGHKLYTEALLHPNLDRIIRTNIHKDYIGNVIFPTMPSWVKCIERNSTYFTNPELSLTIYQNKRDEESSERQYLNLISDILLNGQTNQTRNGFTKGLFGRTLTFDLQEGFPLLTTKRMFYRSIVEELLFFLRGDTNTKILTKKGIKIWEGNTSKEFLDSRNLSYEEGDMGPMYGYQWRHFGHPYSGCQSDYKNTGYDQLRYVIHELLFNPHSRRIIMTTYNPVQIEDAVLPPCHGLVTQFYVRDTFLDVQMYQRSADVGLGLPYNIASYATLVHMIAHVTGYRPGKLVIVLGDTHIYDSHITNLSEQITRVPLKQATLIINKPYDNVDDMNVDTCLQYIVDLTISDIKIESYAHHPVIKMAMVV